MGLSEALHWPDVVNRLAVDRERELLSGSRCQQCGVTTWPARSVCPDCADATTEPATFGPEGVLLSYADVWVSLAGLDVPYILGEVEVADGPPIIAHIRGLPKDASLPLRVSLVFAEREGAVPPFWFVPAPDEETKDLR